jgi:hypothetical protein
MMATREDRGPLRLKVFCRKGEQFLSAVTQKPSRSRNFGFGGSSSLVRSFVHHKDPLEGLACRVFSEVPLKSDGS